MRISRSSPSACRTRLRASAIVMAYRAANLSRQHLALERCACVGANEDSRLSRNVISERDRRSMRRMRVNSGVVSIHDERVNQCLVQSNPGAAHSVLRPLCLLPGFAAQPHVGRAGREFHITHERSTHRFRTIACSAPFVGRHASSSSSVTSLFPPRSLTSVDPWKPRKRRLLEVSPRLFERHRRLLSDLLDHRPELRIGSGPSVSRPRRPLDSPSAARAPGAALSRGSLPVPR